jgi:DNA-binding ferritin-like protein
MSKLLIEFLQLQNNLRLFHWRTKIYELHLASGNLYKALDDLIDKFIESYQGVYDSIDIKNKSLKIYKIIDLSKYLKSCKRKIKKYSKDFNDTELLNLIDEILVEIDKTIYLTTLL